MKGGYIMFTKNEVIKKAKAFCKENQIITCPVNIIDICNEKGIKVLEAYLPPEVSGYIMTSKNGVPGYDADQVIIVNLSDAPTRRRFTIAHELAHYVLHKKPEDDIYAHRDVGEYNSKEREANIFASNILMPEELVREEIRRLCDTMWGDVSPLIKINRVAERFAVSSSAAEVRLKELNEL